MITSAIWLLVCIVVVLLFAYLIVAVIDWIAAQAGSPIPSIVRTIIMVIAALICLLLLLNFLGGATIHLPRIQ
jgi:hypothetical protein